MTVRTTWLFLFLTITSHAQEEHQGKPCIASAQLKVLTIKSNVAAVYVSAGNEDAFCSSVLKPDTPNKATLEDYARMDDANKSNYESWSCQYGARNVEDNNPKTAWVEGAQGPGAGEVLLITEQINVQKRIEIWGGLGSSNALFKANNRPKTIRVHVIRATPDSPGQYGTNYRNLISVASAQIILKDLNGFQPLTVPAIRRETFTRDQNDWEYAYWLLLEIVDVYPGSQYQDTCISEIRNVK